MRKAITEFTSDLTLFKHSPICQAALVLSSLFVTSIRVAFSGTSGSSTNHKSNPSEEPQTYFEEHYLPLLLNRSWVMEEICGTLQKQSDILGWWKDRYFRLTRLTEEELSSIQGVQQGAMGHADAAFVLMYWVGDAAMATTAACSRNPRGVYLVSGSWIEFDPSKPDTLVLYGLRNAREPQAQVNPMFLKGLHRKSIRRWISSLTYASMANMILPPKNATPETNLRILDTQVQNFTVNAKLVEQVQFVQLIVTDNKRVFVLTWDSEEQASSQPSAAQNMYETTFSNISLLASAPLELSIEHVRDIMPVNMHPSNGSIRFTMQSRVLAENWAKMMSGKALIEPVKSPKKSPVKQPMTSPKGLGESLVDEIVFVQNDTEETMVDELRFDSPIQNNKNQNVLDSFDLDHSENSSVQANFIFDESASRSMDFLTSWRSSIPHKLSPVMEEDSEKNRSFRSDGGSGKKQHKPSPLATCQRF